MLITNTSTLTGIKHTREINCTQEMINDWQNGALIQNVMPHLSNEDREFLITGTTPEEWDKAFPPEDED